MKNRSYFRHRRARGCPGSQVHSHGVNRHGTVCSNSPPEGSTSSGRSPGFCQP